MAQYAIEQRGMIVAATSGPNEDAEREINHYAAQYVQDGPIKIHGPVDDGVCLVCFLQSGARLECDCDDFH